MRWFCFALWCVTPHLTRGLSIMGIRRGRSLRRALTGVFLFGGLLACSVVAGTAAPASAGAATAAPCGNGSLVSVLPTVDGPFGIAVSGSDLFVTNFENNTMGEFTTSGATVNASLITGLDEPEGIAVSGTDLFVVKG